MCPAELMEISRREGVLIYDNSYNMPPVTHYHPHQTTTERKGLWVASTATTQTTQRVTQLATEIMLVSVVRI